VPRRYVLAPIIVGLGAILAGIARVESGGQNATVFALAIIAGVAIFAVVLAYGVVLYRNTTLYVHAGRVGTTNWLGLRHEVSCEMVQRLQRSKEDPYGTGRPIAVLTVVTTDPRDQLKIFAADALEPGGVERVAFAIGVSVDGNW
jgi:hypothetical protein